MKNWQIAWLRISPHVAVSSLIWLVASQSWAASDATQVREWAAAILNKVSQMPRMQAIEADLAAVRATGKAASRPVYNPELNADYDDKADREYALSVAQTVDWSGKKDARTKAADADTQVAFYRFKTEKDRILADAMRALNQHTAAEQALRLVRQQSTWVKHLTDVINQRREAGDLGMLDSELAKFTLSESVYQVAQAQRKVHMTAADVEVQLGHTLALPVPEIDWPESSSTDPLDQLLRNLPSLSMVKAQFDAASRAVEIARSESRADPTIGFGTGRDGDMSVVQLSVSVPLFIRNRFTDEIEARRQEALSAELAYLNERRVLVAKLGATSATYKLLVDNWRDWQQLTQAELDNSKKLLFQLWGSGDIDTATYVFGQQQRAQAMLAGIEFKRDLFEAWIDWLETSGQVESWLKNNALQIPGSN